MRLLGSTMMLMGACAEECIGECETSAVLQRVNRKGVTTAGPTQQLLQAATKMLRDGTTPAVLTFTQDTLKEIKNEVIPKIIANHKHDQAMLDSQLEELNTIIKDYKKELETLTANYAVEAKAEKTHVTCRGTGGDTPAGEYEKCLIASEKNWIRAKKWRILLEWEGKYTGISTTIHKRFCPVGIETWHSKTLGEHEINEMVPDLVTYRTWTKNYMMKFNEQGAYYFRTTIVEWLAADGVAAPANASHRSAKMQCDSDKKILEEKSCARAQHHAQTIETFETDFNAAELIMNKTKENVVLSEADRIREFVTLNVVQCLLKKIEDKNGTKCEEETDEADKIIENCETEDVLTVILEIDYPCSPDKPPHDPIKCYPGNDRVAAGGGACYWHTYFQTIEDFGFCFSDGKYDERLYAASVYHTKNSFPMPKIHNTDCKIVDVSMYY